MPSDVTKPSRQDQAAAWFAAERAGAMIVEQRAAFDEWRADPRNQAALDQMHALWDDLAVLKGTEPAPRKAATSQAFLVAAALILALIGGIGTVGWLTMKRGTSITTVAGQQKTQSMPDGSVIAVNVASDVTYAMTDHRRVVTIADGEAAFSVKPDPAKPFVVRAGNFEVRAVGTFFNVRQRDGMLQVAVSEGRVEVCRVLESGEELVLARLSAGQSLAFPTTLSATAPIPAPVSVPPAQVSEWRMRTVTYEDASVRDVVDDFNRYFDRKLSVDQAHLLNQRVTVRLQVEDRERAVETLAALLGAKIAITDRGDVLAN